MKNQNKYHNFDRKVLDPFTNSHIAKSTWQLSSTIMLYALLWWLMYLTLSVSYLFTLILSLFAAAMVIRLFIMFHDCAHGSYFKSSRMNNIVGHMLSLFVFTPFYFWKKDHLKHHGSVCNLDQRGKGDIWTMSLRDYQDAPLWERFKYRFSRNPFAIFFTAPIFLRNRLVPKKSSFKDRLSIYLTNLVLLGIIVVFSYFLGFRSYILIQMPTLFFASAIGSWLFYVQHQFAGARWERTDQWDHLIAVFEGTSFYDLPKVLHWLTGNIGYHHVHHLNPRIPNYNLAKCHNSIAELKTAPILSLRSSLKTLNNHLWDENKGQFVGFNVISTPKGAV